MTETNEKTKPEKKTTLSQMIENEQYENCQRCYKKIENPDNRIFCDDCLELHKKSWPELYGPKQASLSNFDEKKEK